MLMTESTSSIACGLLGEFEMQAGVTRRYLERLPEERLGWRPHAKSMTAGQLAWHLATVPEGVLRLVENDAAQAPRTFEFPQPGSRQQILDMFEAGCGYVRQALPRFEDGAMRQTFHLMSDDRELLAVPRVAFLRDVMFSHWYQHRGQFAVYLRLMDVAVPASWGPSADEPPLFLQEG